MTDQPLRRPTVAIVGSHPDTRDKFDFSRTDCDVWVFNEVLGSENEEWCKRADGVFQMHKPVIWRSTQNRNDPKHYEWLQNNQDTTVYMTDRYEDVPKSESFPLDEIKASLPRAYFTSSVAYALALAVHFKYKRIEVYGVEMETGTEYGHQRVGVAYWIGVADGMGIEVEFYSNKFFNSPLYGYEGDIRLDINVFVDRVEKLTEAQKHAQNAHNLALATFEEITGDWVRDWKTDISQLDEVITACGQTGHNFGMVDGALQVSEKYLAKCKKMLEETGDYLIVRQEIEASMYAGLNERNDKYNQVLQASAEMSHARGEFNKINNTEYREKVLSKFLPLLEEFVRTSTWTGIGTGISNENRNLMMIYDQTLAAQGISDAGMMQQDMMI